jgi:hypothetical protein
MFSFGRSGRTQDWLLIFCAYSALPFLAVLKAVKLRLCINEELRLVCGFTRQYLLVENELSVNSARSRNY